MLDACAVSHLARKSLGIQGLVWMRQMEPEAAGQGVAKESRAAREEKENKESQTCS